MATGLYIARNFLASISPIADPDREKHEQARLRAKAHLERLRKGAQGRGRERDGTGDAGAQDASDKDSASRQGPRVEDLALNEYENLIALEMVAPGDIAVGFDGKDHI